MFRLVLWRKRLEQCAIIPNRDRVIWRIPAMDKSLDRISIIVQQEDDWIELVADQVGKGLYGQLQRAFTCHEDVALVEAQFLASNECPDRGAGRETNAAKHCLVVHEHILDVRQAGGGNAKGGGASLGDDEVAVAEPAAEGLDGRSLLACTLQMREVSESHGP